MTFDQSKIRQAVLERRTGICSFLLDFIKQNQMKTTLLAVCPNSEAVLEGAIVAAQKANAPLLYAVTLNQVDLDGGYTGWTQTELVKKIKSLSERYSFSEPTAICLDHGGPWLKDNQKQWDFQSTMAAVQKSLEACLDAQYDLLHIDTTLDPWYTDASVPLHLVVNRAVEFIRYAEDYRRKKGYLPVDYEVGSEEVNGGLTEVKVFQEFLHSLQQQLRLSGLGVWPSFIVGQVGTDLHTSSFDRRIAGKLVETLRPYGSVLKGHYTDFVDNPELYPTCGVGAANIGPEFTAVEYQALRELEKREQQFHQQGKIKALSHLGLALRDTVVDSGRWKKWLHKNEKEIPFSQLTEERQDWLVQTGSRYIWTADKVQQARKLLYENLHEQGIHAHQRVIDTISDSIFKYYKAFNLLGLTSKIESKLLRVLNNPYIST